MRAAFCARVLRASSQAPVVCSLRPAQAVRGMVVRLLSRRGTYPNPYLKPGVMWLATRECSTWNIPGLPPRVGSQGASSRSSGKGADGLGPENPLVRGQQNPGRTRRPIGLVGKPGARATNEIALRPDFRSASTLGNPRKGGGAPRTDFELLREASLRGQMILQFELGGVRGISAIARIQTATPVPPADRRTLGPERSRSYGVG
jgi:hypothetical protein